MASFVIGSKNVLLLILATYCSASSSDNVEKSGRANLVSFRPLGKQVLLGLDILVPFLTVPTGKKHSENGSQNMSRALINIDTSSLIISGIIISGGIALSQLLQTLGLQTTTTEDMMSEERFGRNVDAQLRNIFPYLIPKLIYTNSTGQWAESTLSQWFANVDQLEDDFDLLACMLKSICSMVYEAGALLKVNKAVGLHKIIDGLAHLKWLPKALPNTALLEAIVAGKVSSPAHCDFKYPRCQWSGPHKKLLELLKTYVRFI